MRYLGITDERDACDCCGKHPLKRVVALETDEGAVVYYGTTCASRNVGKAQIKALRSERLEELEADLATANRVRFEVAQRLYAALDRAAQALGYPSRLEAYRAVYADEIEAFDETDEIKALQQEERAALARYGAVARQIAAL